MSYVYFICPEALLHRSDAVVKIGFTKKHPNIRLSTLQTGSPEVLKLWAYTKGSAALETAFHEAFAELRSHGEWFFVVQKLYDFLGYLGQEPDVGNLISRERLAEAVHDNIFSNSPPHPDICPSDWLKSANPESLARHFPHEWESVYS